MHPFEVGDHVVTVRPIREPTGYFPGVRDGNRWGVRGIVREVQGGHGICYRVQHLDLDSDGWYEPDELKAGSCPRNLWDHLAEG